MQGSQGGYAGGMLRELGSDILRFPAWWYGAGLLRAATYAMSFITGYARRLGVGVWIQNLFVPMFGRYDWQSRIISVFMRLVNILGRGFVTAIVAVVVLGVFVAYVSLPVVSMVLAVYHATSIFAL